VPYILLKPSVQQHVIKSASKEIKRKKYSYVKRRDVMKTNGPRSQTYMKQTQGNGGPGTEQAANVKSIPHSGKLKRSFEMLQPSGASLVSFSEIYELS
jgi:hypothetical protein